MEVPRRYTPSYSALARNIGDVVAHELLAQVLDEDVLGLDAEQLRLLARRPQLLALAEIGVKVTTSAP